MEDFEHEETPAEGTTDPTSELSSGDTPSPEGSPSGSTGDSFSDASSRSDETVESSEPSSETTPDSSSSTNETSSDEPPPSGDGLLTGTGSELEEGVGGSGDHPTAAVMRDPQTGELHSAGQPPSGTVAAESSPAGDNTDAVDESHALSPEAAQELGGVHEPDQVETERPDLGTE